jgi:branched-chain amino acid transport system ATP-binding protein
MTPEETKAPAAEEMIATGNLIAGYGDLAAVRDLSLTVNKGEMVALIGPNGAGKTTTLATMAGILRPLGGEVRWRGEPTTAPLHALARDGLGFIPETGSVFMKMSTRDNLRLVPAGLDDALDLFPELKPLLNRPAGLLSGGEQQMLTIGRALSRRPHVLLIDELSLGLAPVVVKRLLSAVRNAAREWGVAVLLVEQQAVRALEVVDRWYLLRHGELLAEGDQDSTSGALDSYLST